MTRKTEHAINAVDNVRAHRTHIGQWPRTGGGGEGRAEYVVVPARCPCPQYNSGIVATDPKTGVIP